MTFDLTHEVVFSLGGIIRVGIYLVVSSNIEVGTTGSDSNVLVLQTEMTIL